MEPLFDFLFNASWVVIVFGALAAFALRTRKDP